MPSEFDDHLEQSSETIPAPADPDDLFRERCDAVAREIQPEVADRVALEQAVADCMATIKISMNNMRSAYSELELLLPRLRSLQCRF